jgi:simple sugar transport system permease protein
MASNDHTSAPNEEARSAPTLRSRFTAGSDVMRLGIAAVVIFLVLSVLSPDIFFSANNLRSMAFQFPEFAILSIAMMLAMLTGGIDLSVVSVANLSAILGALVMTQIEPGSPSVALLAGITVALATGLIAGAFNALLIASLGVSPILTTLGTMQLYSGIAIVITGGAAVHGFPQSFLHLGNGTVLGVPIPVILLGIVAVAVGVLLSRTSHGERVYMYGTNPRGAVFAGIRRARVLIATYVLTGGLSALAGLVMAARTNSAKAGYGSSYLLLAILIVVLGGVKPNGGVGRVAGVLLAVLCLQFISSGLNIMQVTSFAKDLVWGGLLLVVMAFNAWSERTS